MKPKMAGKNTAAMWFMVKETAFALAISSSSQQKKSKENIIKFIDDLEKSVEDLNFFHANLENQNTSMIQI